MPVPAGTVENGKSGPRRSGKFEIGAWLAEPVKLGQSPAIPLHEAGMLYFFSPS